MTQYSNNCVTEGVNGNGTVLSPPTQYCEPSAELLCIPNQASSNGSSSADTVCTEAQLFSENLPNQKFPLNANVTITGESGTWKVIAVEPAGDGFMYTVVNGKKQFRLAEFHLSAIDV